MDIVTLHLAKKYAADTMAGAGAIKGDKGDPGPEGPAGADGAPGPKGDPGDTPYIGDNGNWWIGDTDTGVNASGNGEGPGTPGPKGDPGTTFTPSVSEAGELSWANDGGLENPAPVNIKGPQGPEGPQGPAGDGANLSAGDGITLQEDTISVTTPVKGVTQAEYDALSEEEKMSDALYVTPQPDYSPSGGSGAVPTGAVISFLGLTAPNGYLICDGTQYEIEKYAGLASFIQEQFGSKNYFGGDGTTTFAVPDMRNLFLRGYHGEATEQLSGEIGAKQEATIHPRAGISGTQMFVFDNPSNEDSASPWGPGIVSNGAIGGNDSLNYTSRPVNMAVLYCIKT